MKKVQMILAILVVAFVAFQGAALAGSVSGTVKSVDAAGKKLELSAADGMASSVSYSDTTKWPAGVTDPATLVGKKVTVATDDVTSTATSVEEAAA